MSWSAQAILNTASNSAGLNAGVCISASVSASSFLTGLASARARSVGTIPWDARTNRGSPKLSRSRFSMLLTAGCVRDSFAAARVTLRSSSRASSALSRLRSNVLILFKFIFMIKIDYWIYNSSQLTLQASLSISIRRNALWPNFAT